jgi:hypothetical protein
MKFLFWNLNAERVPRSTPFDYVIDEILTRVKKNEEAVLSLGESLVKVARMAEATRKKVYRDPAEEFEQLPPLPGNGQNKGPDLANIKTGDFWPEG